MQTQQKPHGATPKQTGTVKGRTWSRLKRSGPWLERHWLAGWPRSCLCLSWDLLFPFSGLRHPQPFSALPKSCPLETRWVRTLTL